MGFSQSECEENEELHFRRADQIPTDQSEGMDDADETKELLRLRAHGSTSATAAAAVERLHGDTRISHVRWMLFSVAGGLIYGYNVSLAASLQYLRDDFVLSPTQEELLSAAATLSDASSMLVGGYLADRYGRKPIAMAACVCSVLGALMASLVQSSVTALVFWRLCTGVGNGLSILLLPMYVSECIDAKFRGSLLTLFQLGVNSGCAIPYVFMVLIAEKWRMCLALGALPALYVLYSFKTSFPESIKWLRWKENPNVVVDIEGGAAPRPPSSPKYRQNDRDESVIDDDSHPRPRLELAIGLLLAYVNNCVDASLFYGPEIIAKTQADFTRRDANIFGLLCSLVAILSVLFAERFLIDKYARRSLYLLCLSVVCVCFLLSGIIFARYSTADFASNPVASSSIMATFAVLNIFAAIGPNTLFVVILSELFQDSSYRATYMSYCTFTMSLVSLLVNGSLLSLFEALGTATTFIAYGATYVACGVFFAFHLPETKQRQLV